MTLSPLEWTGPYDARRALAARPGLGVLGRLGEAGWLAAADVHVASRVAGLLGEDDDAVLAGLALTVGAAREGSSCLDLAAAAAVLGSGTPDAGDGAPAWRPPAPQDWARRLAASRCAADGVVRIEDGLVYLDRYHREEVQVAADLLALSGRADEPVGDEALAAGLARVFPGPSWTEQREAVRAAVRRALTVLVGGPGTGKTSTVAGLLALLTEQAEATGRRPRVALAAPTGKAAARLGESVTASLARMPAPDRARVGDLSAVTVHRLLGWRPDSRTRFRHDRVNPLPHDVVIVDEASMLSLTLTARLLEALRPGARLILVGDPDQLASVDAGAVLADLVGGFAGTGDASPVRRLATAHRYGAGIAALAEAVRTGDADRTLQLLRAAGSGQAVQYVEVADPERAEAALRGTLVGHALALRELAQAGDLPGALEALGRHRLLCAHRAGPWGVASWNARVERWLAEASGPQGRTPAGRPLLVTANDYRLGLANGDTGVVAARPDRRLAAVFGDPSAPVVHGLSSIADVTPAHAMTIHKSQGSQARHVSVLLPQADSRLLTRELLYTAITRAQDRLTVVGSEEAIRVAVATYTARASGLARRLAGPTAGAADAARS